MEISYCGRWWRSRAKPIDTLSAEDARRRHVVRSAYAAVIGPMSAPQYVVELAGKWVSVLFLAERGQVFLQYDFEELVPGRVFLGLAVHRQFNEKSGDLEVGVLFRFHTDGLILMERTDRSASIVERREARESVEPNWDFYPEFGDYVHLCRAERMDTVIDSEK